MWVCLFITYFIIVVMSCNITLTCPPEASLSATSAWQQIHMHGCACAGLRQRFVFMTVVLHPTTVGCLVMLSGYKKIWTNNPWDLFRGVALMIQDIQSAIHSVALRVIQLRGLDVMWTRKSLRNWWKEIKPLTHIHLRSHTTANKGTAGGTVPGFGPMTVCGWTCGVDLWGASVFMCAFMCALGDVLEHDAFLSGCCVSLVSKLSRTICCTWTLCVFRNLFMKKMRNIQMK